MTNNAEQSPLDEYSLYIAHSVQDAGIDRKIQKKRTFASGYELHSGGEVVDQNSYAGRDRNQQQDFRQMEALEAALYRMEGPARVTVITTSSLIEETINHGNEVFEERLPAVHANLLEHVEEKDISLWAMAPDEDDDEAQGHISRIQKELRRRRREFERTLRDKE